MIIVAKTKVTRRSLKPAGKAKRTKKTAKPKTRAIKKSSAALGGAVSPQKATTAKRARSVSKKAPKKTAAKKAGKRSATKKTVKRSTKAK